MKYLENKILFLAIFALFSLLPLRAAGFMPVKAASHFGELLVGFNAGPSYLSLSNKLFVGTSEVKSKLDFSYGISLEYNVALVNNKKFQLGLLLGLKYSVLSGSSSFGNLKDTAFHQIEKDGDRERDFNFMTDITEYKSKSTISYIQVPVYFQETFRISSHVSWFIEEGVTFGYGINGTTVNSIKELKTSGYFPDAKVIIPDPNAIAPEDYRPQDGFSKYPELKFNGKNNLNKFVVDAHFETGVKTYFGGFYVMYVGVYVDYAILPSYKSASSDMPTDLIQYQTETPSKFKYASSLYDSKYGANNEVHPLSFGVNLRFGLNFDRMALRGGERMFDE